MESLAAPSAWATRPRCARVPRRCPRLGIDTRVYLSSAELASVCALMGKIPTVAEYMEQVKALEAKAADVYRYMNFNQITEFKEVADNVTV
jgi:aconitate hydratase 2 / 2-methylisocitrate dehydratase